MDLLRVVVTLLVVGVLTWLMNKYLAPYVDVTILKIINIVIVVAVVVWLLRVFGIFNLMPITVG